MAKRNDTKTSTARNTAGLAALNAIVKLARTVTPASIIADVKRNVGTYTTATRNVGRYTGMRVTAFQNASFVANATWQLDDCQLLFVWACEFPGAVGRVFAVNGRMGTPGPVNVRDGIAIIRGVRGEYNRNGHGDPSIPHGPKTPITAYGPSRFDIAIPAATVPAPATKPARKPAARKPVAA